jgi:hypothetical protein
MMGTKQSKVKIELVVVCLLSLGIVLFSGFSAYSGGDDDPKVTPTETATPAPYPCEEVFSGLTEEEADQECQTVCSIEPPDDELLGLVRCCNGTKYPCAFVSGTGGGPYIVRSCVELHEQTHIDQDCECSDPCLGVCIYTGNEDESECGACTAELQCLQNSAGQCYDLPVSEINTCLSTVLSAINDVSGFIDEYCHDDPKGES